MFDIYHFGTTRGTRVKSKVTWDLNERRLAEAYHVTKKRGKTSGKDGGKATQKHGEEDFENGRRVETLSKNEVKYSL